MLSSARVRDLQEEAAVGTISTALVLALGVALLLAPVLFGRKWPSYVLWAVAALCGAVVSNYFIKAEWNRLPGQDEAKCITSMVAILVAAVIAAGVAISIIGFAFFAVGAMCGAYGGWIVAGLIAPFLKDRDDTDVKEQEKIVWIAVAVCTVAGGTILCRFRDRLIDIACGFVGAVLVAQNPMMLVGKSEEASDKLHLARYYSFYFAALVVALLALRNCLMSSRRRKSDSSDGP
jgi:hypothetical protein